MTETNLSKIPTCYLVVELEKRDGVEVKKVGPYEKLEVFTEGPSIVLVVTD